MATQLQIRRGTSAQVAAFTGAEGEIVVNTTNDSVHVNDGSTAGGFELARVDGSNWAITNAISTTANISFGDNDKAIFGAGSDLQIYHSGSASIIEDTGTGDLVIKGTDLYLRNASNSNRLYAGTDTRLYYDGNEKIRTTSTGIDVTGTAAADKLIVNSGATDEVARFEGTGSPYISWYDTGVRQAYIGSFGNNFSIVGDTPDTTVSISTGGTPRLTVDATGVGIGTSSPASNLEISDSTQSTGATFSITNSHDGLWTSGDKIGSIDFRIDDGSTTQKVRAKVHAEGRTTGTYPADSDLVFSTADNNTLSEAMRIDSAGLVGIGTNIPDTLMHLSANTGATLTLESTDTAIATNEVIGAIDFYSNDASGIGAASRGSISLIAQDAAGAGSMLFKTSNASSASTERMRIDSSGNALFGKTAASSATVGFQVGQDGFTAITRASGQPLVLNRTTTDGIIADFRKDGTTVGSIRTISGDSVGIGTGDAGLRFVSSTNRIQPVDMDNGLNSDGLTSLGDTNKRFKDLHLSGTAYVATRLGIGTSSPTKTMVVNENDSECVVVIKSSDTGSAGVYLGGQSDEIKAGMILDNSTNALIFRGYNNAERLRIDSSGNALFGTTNTAPYATSTTGGMVFRNDFDLLGLSRSNNYALSVNRYGGTNGDLINFRKDGTTFGSIGVGAASNYLAIGNTNTSIQFYAGGIAPATGSTSTLSDNTKDIGSASIRWDDIYATNGTIQTSDRNEKQDIDALSDAEQRVAVAAKGLLRKFRWKSSVAENGDDARIHFGIIAQDLQAAFEAEGLDAGRYAMFINSTWTDEDTGEERTRMGVRYSELLAFIISAI